MPLALGIALFVSHYAPQRLAGPVAYVIDLLAAVPCVVYGLWGIVFLAPHLLPVYDWLDEHLGFMPVLRRARPRSPAAPSSPPASCWRS